MLAALCPSTGQFVADTRSLLAYSGAKHASEVARHNQRLCAAGHEGSGQEQPEISLGEDRFFVIRSTPPLQEFQTIHTLCMHKQQVVQRLYDDAQGVRRCEVCGCRFDPARMQLHMQRYSCPPGPPYPCCACYPTFSILLPCFCPSASRLIRVCAVTAERSTKHSPRRGHGHSPLLIVPASPELPVVALSLP